MSSIAEIRHHIKAISETAKITRAMHLIASAKMKKALQAHDQTVHYYSLVRSNMRFILDNAPDDFRSDFYRANGKRACYLVIAGDKGMCGGYNHDVLKLAYQEISNPRHLNTRLVTFGHMATDFFRRKGVTVDASYLTAVQNPTLDKARELAVELCRRYRHDEFDEVFVIFTQMLNRRRDETYAAEPAAHHQAHGCAMCRPCTAQPAAWISGRMRAACWTAWRQHYVVGVIYSCLVQSYASENPRAHDGHGISHAQRGRDAQETAPEAQPRKAVRHHTGDQRDYRRQPG